MSCTTTYQERKTHRQEQVTRRYEDSVQRCELRWWNPLSWFCWLVTTILYVVETVWVEVTEVVTFVNCTVNTFIGAIANVVMNPRVCSDNSRRPVPGVARMRATAMNVADVGRDTFAQFRYRDSGSHLEFRITSSGGVEMSRNGGPFEILKRDEDHAPLAVSYNRRRRWMSDTEPAPPFEMIAACSGRVIAKERDTDAFYILLPYPMFAYSRPAQGGGIEYLDVPSNYFKLDPEIGRFSGDVGDLLDHLRGDFNNHPQSVRFGVFRRLLSLNSATPLLKAMAVRVEPRVWHLLDVRPPSANESGDLPAWVEGYQLLSYRSNLLPFDEKPVQAIQFHRVLGLGAGHMHYHEQYNRSFGGEMQPIMAQWKNIPTPFLPVRLILEFYRFFNGPVSDGDGFVDGTANYYALVQLKSDSTVAGNGEDTRDAFGVMWMDEQSIFTKRWRLLHPEDYRSDGSKVGLLNFMLPAFLVWVKQSFPKNDPFPEYSQERFWCPSRAGHLTDRSRMAVSRAVIMVNGIDRSINSNAPIHEIYSVNFAFASMDYTWRWRRLPPELAILDVTTSDEIAGAAKTNTPPCAIAPATLELREDMTLHIGGTDSLDDSQSPQVGRWYQRYLPANHRMFPGLPDDLVPGAKPREGFHHRWHFLPQATFQRAAYFSHFGVYEQIDARRQYYRVSLPAGFSPDESIQWMDRDTVLTIRQPGLDWEKLNAGIDAWENSGLDQLLTNPQGFFSNLASFDPAKVLKDEFRPPSVLNRQTFLRLASRPGVGHIALWWDKRDDDLAAFSNNMSVDVALVSTASRVTISLDKHCETNSPPCVDSAILVLAPTEDKGLLSIELVLQFSNTQDTDEHSLPDIGNVCCAPLWRARLGVLDDREPGHARVIAEWNLHGILPSRSGEARSFYATIADTDVMHLTESGRWANGTSLWVTDIIGQSSVPDDLVLPNASGIGLGLGYQAK